MKEFIALLLYRFLCICLLPVLVVALLIRSINYPAYRHRLAERFGFFPKSKQQNGIIVHAASVGEVIALKPFIEQLLIDYPQLPLTVTTFTPTGSAQVHKQFGTKVQHGYLPLDCWPFTTIFLNGLKPQLVVFMETELWPNIIAQAKSRHIKLALINGRLSNKSINSYLKLRWLMKPTLNYFDHILCQSADNLTNFIKLGADPRRCEVSGNVKFDIQLDEGVLIKQQELALLLPDNNENRRPVWLVASTHPGDEALCLAAFSLIREQHPSALLILVPRHPERFESVANLCKTEGFSVVRRSSKQKVFNEDIWLLDTLGELMPAYGLADVVTMGGSFSMIGGHNPLEPALFKKPIVVGSDMANFRRVFEQLSHVNGIIQLPAELTSSIEKSTHLACEVNALFSAPDKQNLLGKQAYSVVVANQGASKLSVDRVKALLTE